MADHGELTTSRDATSRPGWRRRAKRSVMVLIGLVLVVVIAVQVVLWSDYPRRLIVSQLQEQLGVKVQLRKVRVGWWGSSRLDDLSLTLPLASEPFFQATNLRVHHSSLLRLALGGALNLDALEIRQGRLQVLGQPDGRWNIQALNFLNSGQSTGSDRRDAAARGAPARTPPPGDLELPDLVLTDCQIHLVSADQRSGSTIDSINFTGHNETGGAYVIDLSAQPGIVIRGQVDRHNLEHHLSISAVDLAQLLQPVWKEIPRPLTIEGTWTGQVHRDGLAARVQLAKLRAEDYSATGALRLGLDQQGATVFPEKVVILSPAADPIMIAGGQIRIDDQHLQVAETRLNLAGGNARLSGQWQFRDSAAEAQIAWQQLTIGNLSSPAGTLQGRLTAGLDGSHRLQMNADFSSVVGDHSLISQIVIVGEGPDWDRMDWSIDAPKLSGHVAGRQMDLGGLHARLLSRDDGLMLRALELPSLGEIAGQGRLSWQGRNPWSLQLQGAEVALDHDRSSRAQFDLQASGDRDRIILQRGDFSVDQLAMRLEGSLELAKAGALVMNIDVSRRDPFGFTLGAQPVQIGSAAGRAVVTGQLQPLELKLTGQMTGRQIRSNQQQIGDVVTNWHGAIGPDQAQLHSDEFELLDGRWRLLGTADYPQGQPADGRMRVAVRALPLQATAAFLGFSGLGGQLNGDWTIDWPQFHFDQPKIQGQFDAEHVTYQPKKSAQANDGNSPVSAPENGDASAPLIQLERVAAQMKLADGVLRVDDLQMQQGQGTASGRLVYHLTGQPDDQQVVQTEMLWTKWRWQPPGQSLTVVLDGSSTLAWDFSTAEITGPVDLAIDLWQQDQHVGALDLAGQFQGRSINVSSMKGKLFDGQIDAQAQLSLDQPAQSTGEVRFAEMDAAAISRIWPQLKALQGRFAGQLHLMPTDPDDRPIAPLKLAGTVHGSDACFESAQIKSLDFDLYLDPNFFGDGQADQTLRLILDHARLEAMGGQIDLWGRYSRYRQLHASAQAGVTFTGISLEQFWRSFIKSEDDPATGQLEGNITLLIDPTQLRHSTGEARIRLSHSDLVRVGAFGVLYDLLHVSAGKSQSTGYGEMRLQLENGNVRIARMNYFDRGLEIWAMGQFEDVWDLGHTRVEATVAGTARPFGQLKLPLLADVQAITGILQRELTTVRVSGTVDQPRYTQAAFGQISQTMRNLLLGEARNQGRRE